ncbi:MAG: hypothetical protein E7293_04145 [Lachnospiraceae bacterium]|nr:hypothetical protein [Lachnospiraceae bacterium]
MKFVKGISLFFVYPVLMFGLGIYTGVSAYQFFYPGDKVVQENQWQGNTDSSMEGHLKESGLDKFLQPDKTPAVETSKKADVLTADTEYILREVDVRKGTAVETVWDVPQRYLGMNRETFVDTMEDYEISPPLQELERGFVGLEVVAFSRERVIVEMHYAYVEPSDTFYLCVENNYVIVYLEDKKTVYLTTDILLDTLPESLQQQIIGYLLIEDEQELYNFLESYSS